MRPRFDLRFIAIAFLALTFSSCGQPSGTTDSAKPETTKPADAPLKNEIPTALLDSVLKAHYQGLGHMERYEYHEASAEFRRVRELAPGWIPGSINLAIALLNDTGNQAEQAKKSRGPSVTGSANFDDAFVELDGVLAREPGNLHAHYCKGIILEYIGNVDEAHQNFKFVAEADPADSQALYKFAVTSMSRTNPGKPVTLEDAPDLVAMFTKVLELNPYLVPAMYRLQQAYTWAGVIEGDSERKKYWRDKHLELSARWHRIDPDKNPAGSGDPFKSAYGETGKYAQVINPFYRLDATKPKAALPRFDLPTASKVSPAKGERWVSPEDFKGSNAVIGRVRNRFGATVASLDVDGDGKSDLLVASAVIGEKGIRDLLLLNRGEGVFEDASAAWGLPLNRASLGVAAGDFDADKKVDLFLCGPSGYTLLRNAGGKFEDITAKVGMDKSKALGLTARWLDLDQDGDLDLYVVNFTDLADIGEAFRKGEVAKVENSAFRNDGKPEPVPPRPEDNWAPLAVAPSDLPAKAGLSLDFAPWPGAPDLTGPPANYTGIAWADIDADHDLDIVLSSEGQPPIAVLNDRLGKFHRAAMPGLEKTGAGGLLVTDLDKDGRADLVVVNSSGTTAWRNAIDRSKTPAKLAFEPWPLNAKSWLNASATDLDLDTWPDLIGLPTQVDTPQLEWGRNDGIKLSSAAVPLGPGPADALKFSGFTLADVSGDPLPDLVIIADGSAPLIARNLGNGEHWLALDLGGRWKTSFDHMRTNSHALGTKITLEGQGLITTFDHTTPTSSLGQSVGPVILGMGKSAVAELVHIRWPDGTMQCELNADADVKLVLAENNRKTGSCPVLFTWNGSRFVCLGDFLGGGGLGYLVAPGVYSQPDRDESVAISSEQLQAVDGVFRLSITEPMDEVAYLDKLRLVVVDRPPGVSATPDERFAPEGHRPTGKVVAWKDTVIPMKSTDLKGNDVSRALASWDRDTVDGFKRLHGWTGYAEEHGIVLDFGDRLSRFTPKDPLLLVLAGWVEYPYSQTNYAAATAGVALVPPSVERLNSDGSWSVIERHAGYPAGMPRMTTLDLTGKLNGPRRVIRIKTNMECYYDQAFVALRDRCSESKLRQTTLTPARAVLGHRGYTREVSPDGRLPLLYDYDYIDPAPLALMSGALTRHGDVVPLLLDDDDQLCLVGPGDEVRLEFSAKGLPPLAEGWSRSFVLESVGYCKDADPFTATNDSVGPLPWRGMPDFPFATPAERPVDPSYSKYLKTYQTRNSGGR